MMIRKTELYRRVKEEIDEVMIVDTHEHLPQEKDRIKEKTDLFQSFFSHYASSDLISSGLSENDMEEIRNIEVPIEKRWRKFKPYWQRIKNTAYARSLLISAQALFGIDDITSSTYKKLSQKLGEANKKGWYYTVLKEKSKIDVSILDCDVVDVDRKFFKPVLRFEKFVLTRSMSDVKKLEKEEKVSIHTLSDLERALENSFSKAAKKDIAGLKIGLAYQRILKFDKVSTSSADNLFARICASASEKRPEDAISMKEAKPFQDYMVHRMIQLAQEHNLPVQVHTGIQEGTGNYIENSKPTHLTNLFFEYPKVRFDIFHGGYPYSRELAVLAKNFQNVYVDMCWFHIICPSAARSMLHEWIETVPGNKIFGFGGDYGFVEGIYGHSVIARENVAQVLAEKVEEEYFDESEAINLGKKILRDNACEFFRIRK